MALLYAQAEASIKKKMWYTIEEEYDGSDNELVEVQQLHSSKGRGRHIRSCNLPKNIKEAVIGTLKLLHH